MSPWRRSPPTPRGCRPSSRRPAAPTQELAGVELIWRQDCYQLPTGRTSFGFKDGIGQPAVEGSGRPPSNPQERPLKAGEIILGYPDETGELPPMPTPDVLGRNGTYVVFRKLHTRVAAYRQYLRAKSASREEEALPGRQDGRALAERRAARARRPSATTRSSAPTRSATTTSSTATIRAASSAPLGAHARRANPRDAFDGDGSVDVRLHRMIRRGTSYGPMLPEGVLEDDGADRGIIFVFAGAHLKRQFEFVKTQWLNDGIFIGAPLEKDPLVGAERRHRDLHHPRSARSAAGCRTCRRSSSPAAASTASPRACARCAGWRSSRRDRPGPTGGGHVATDPTGTDRWKALDFGPPPADVDEPDSPVLVDYLADGRVALITLNRPHADNAITTEMGARLTEIVETIAVRTAVRVVILTGAGDRAFSVGSDLRQRKSMTKEDWLRQRQDFDRTLYTRAPAAQADLRRRQRDRLRRRLRARPEHRLHHRLRERHLRPARGDARSRRRRRLAGAAAPPAAAGQGTADAHDRRPDHRAGGAPARHGQRAPPAGRADGRGAADRRRRSRATRPRRCRRSSGPSSSARASRSSRRSRS